ncbi:MAG: glycogen/starch/alpha-glucan family phosphorylase, partial [Planctomycetes bacterium]|nr:glycogen/starch/alpha-glucan family phosphorylase [Planctomycetota bacterium]
MIDLPNKIVQPVTGDNWELPIMDCSEKSLHASVLHHLRYTLGQDQYTASLYDLFFAVTRSVRDLLMEGWIRTQQTYHRENAKRVYYLSMEYLIGRLLEDSLINLGIRDGMANVVKSFGSDLGEIVNEELDAGLGNGGLGRLAACFMDSLATLGLPAFGYGIRYEFGLFHQKIVNNRQVEEPDHWLRKGDPWGLLRPRKEFRIKYYGRTETYKDEVGRIRSRWLDTKDITALPYDILVPGYRNTTVNTLRLWSAHAADTFDLEFFNDGNYLRAWERIVLAENISKVLYPRDDNSQGKELRLKQEYFFVSASIQDIIRRHLGEYGSLDNLSDKVAIQLNDTHPAIGIPELMRLLMDEYGQDWDSAWKTTSTVFAYTNHTLMSEALEKWPVGLIFHLLPRLGEIIFGINESFMKNISEHFPGDFDRMRRMSIIEEDHGRNIRMAHLAIVGSRAVNGVARIHSELLKSKTFKDFYEIMPRRFTNKTNGITQRRWLLKSNPGLSALIGERIGWDWISDLHELRELQDYMNDRGFLEEWRKVKLENKRQLIALIEESNKVSVDPLSLFDCQIKRIHEYKRQHLNLLHVVSRYLQIMENNKTDFLPRTVIFAGKAAP